MKTIIIGAGKVGYSLAEMLSLEGHDVTVIENDESRRQIVQDALDVQTIKGSGSNPSVLLEVGVEQANMLIAVTELDELNIVACLTAKHYGVKKTVARVRNPDYVKNWSSDSFFSGIDLMINPEQVTAMQIEKLLDAPEALNVEYYADGKVQMLELCITDESPVVNVKLKDLPFDYPYLLVAIIRNGCMMIPNGNDMLLPKDLVFVIGKTEEMVSIEKILGKKRQKIEQIFILGGGRTGFFLAQLLEKKKHLSVKILDNRKEVCEELAEKLQSTLVLHGDGTDTQILKNEQLCRVDAFVAVTGDDKANLLVSLLAKHLGAKKTIAQMRRSDYAPLVEQVGIDTIVLPRMLTAAAILQNIRKGQVVSVTLVEGAKAEILELIVPDHCANTGKSLKNLSFPKNAILGAISRAGQIIIPGGEDQFLPCDRVIIFALPEARAKVEDFFDKKKNGFFK